MTALMELRNIDAGYSATRVLRDVSLTIAEGESVAVLGANGAGKTTLMKTIAGLVKPHRGDVRFAGERISDLRADDIAVHGVALAPEGRGIFTTLSIEENLTLGAQPLRRRLGRRTARARTVDCLDAAYAMFPILRERRTSLASALSGGQQQMLAIARALMSEPRLLILDEPCLGLAPKVGHDVYEILRALRARGGLTVIIVEESATRALSFADRACVLKVGRKVLEDRCTALEQDGRLFDAYFGVATGAEAKAS